MVVTEQNGIRRIFLKSHHLYWHYCALESAELFWCFLTKTLTPYISTAASVLSQLHCRHAATQFLVYPWWLLLLYHSVSCMTAAVFLDQYYIMSFWAVKESCIKLPALFLWKCRAEPTNSQIIICSRSTEWKWKRVDERFVYKKIRRLGLWEAR